MTRSAASRAPSGVSSPPSKPRGGRSGRPSSKFGTVNYSVDEMRRLNAKVRAVLPLAGEDWLHVAYQFNYLRPEAIPYREVESLKRKFKKMYCSRGSGGRLPDYIVEAKELRRLINQRSDGKSQAESETTEEKDEMTEEQQRQDAESEAETGGDIAVKLRQMEEEYHRTLDDKRVDEVEEGAAVAAAVDAMASSVMQAQPAGTWLTGETPTSSVIAMLRHSVEKKRRTVEEQMLSESERVRRERKKRKMEQVLLSIHQEQQEREREGAGEVETEATTPPPAYTNHHITSPGQQQGMSSFAASSGTSVPPSFYPAGALNQLPAVQDSSPLGVMELLLQFMTAQQIENAQRLEAEQARREQEQREREERRLQKDLQRRKDHRELMLAFAALLGDRFPDALKHHEEGDQPQLQSSIPTSSIMEALGVGQTVGTQSKDTADDTHGNQSPADAASVQAIPTERNNFVNEVSSVDAQEQDLEVEESTSAVL